MLYILYDADGVSSNPIYGVFTLEDKVNKAANILAKQMTKECLAVNPIESGLTIEDDPLIFKEIRESFGIQTIDNLDELIYSF